MITHSVNTYKYLMSVDNGRALGTHKASLAQFHDVLFPNWRGARRLLDRDCNLFKASSHVKNQGKIAIKNILGVIKGSYKYRATTSATRIIKATLTPQHLCPITYLNHRPIILDYFNLHSAMNDIRRAFKSWSVSMLASSTELTQQGMSAYVHNHMAFSTHDTNSLPLVRVVMDAIASKYGYDVYTAPLATITANTAYDSAGYKAITHYTNYIYKQGKLPNPSGYKSKSSAIYHRWHELTDSQRRLFIIAIKNSTRGMKLKRHISYKMWSKRALITDTAGITFKLHKYHVVAQQALFNISEVQSYKVTTQTHYHNYINQWKSALHDAENHGRAVHQDKASDQSDLSAEYLVVLNSVYIALNIVHEYDCIRDDSIFTCTQLNQNKNRLYKADFYNGDRLRATGTPP